MADLYGLDAQAAQVRARLRAGESVRFLVYIVPGAEVSVVVAIEMDHGHREQRQPANRIEDVLRPALAWLEKRDVEGER